MTETQSTIWELLNIPPTQDKKVVAEALAEQMETEEDLAKIQRLQEVWHAHRTAEITQAEQSGTSSFQQPVVIEKSGAEALLKDLAED